MIIKITDAVPIEDFCRENCRLVRRNDEGEVDIFKEIEEITKPKMINSSNMLDITETSKVEMPKSDAEEPRVMIFEDDPLLRDLLSTKLLKNNIKHQIHHQGKTALALIKEYQPTVIILDISLPDVNGLSLLQDIRGSKDISDVSVIIFSNKDNQEDRDRAKKLGVRAFLVKAMTDLNDLVNLIIEAK